MEDGCATVTRWRIRSDRSETWQQEQQGCQVSASLMLNFCLVFLTQQALWATFHYSYVERLTWLFALKGLKAWEVFDICWSVSVLEREKSSSISALLLFSLLISLILLSWNCSFYATNTVSSIFELVSKQCWRYIVTDPDEKVISWNSAVMYHLICTALLSLGIFYFSISERSLHLCMQSNAMWIAPKLLLGHPNSAGASIFYLLLPAGKLFKP